jgi:uncharacterized RDD family membrane protein YckC
MSNEQTLLSSQEFYAGFWIRLGAFCIDTLIVTPLFAPLLFMDGMSKTMYYALLAPNIVFGLFLSIYCVKKWGGTPGKLALGLKIVMENGKDVDWPAVFWRPSIIYFHYFVSTAVKLLSMEQIPNEVFASLSHLERTQALSAVYPKLSLQLLILGNIWLLESFFLLANRKRKAIHDYMAGTVVIRRKDQARLRAGEEF